MEGFNSLRLNISRLEKKEKDLVFKNGSRHIPQTIEHKDSESRIQGHSMIRNSQMLARDNSMSFDR